MNSNNGVLATVDITEEIFSYLNPFDAHVACHVCHYWSALLCTSKAPKICGKILRNGLGDIVFYGRSFIRYAARIGSQELVKWSYERDKYFPSDIAYYAMYGRNTNILEYIHAQGFKFQSYHVFLAVNYNLLPELKALLRCGARINWEFIWYFACRDNSQEMETFLRETWNSMFALSRLYWNLRIRYFPSDV